MYAMGDELIQGIKDIATSHEINLSVQGLGSVFNTSFTYKPKITNYEEHLKYTDIETFKKFRANLQDNGVRITSRGTWMLSTSHTSTDIEKTLNAVESSIKNEFQSYLMKKGYDVVGYGLRLCSHELAFENYKSNLINAKYVHDNTLFLPLFENLKENEIKKIADDINYFFDNK